MVRRLPHLLAILTATATLLAGIPLFAAALAPAGGPGPCLCTSPFDADDGGESCGAESEEREQEEDGDGKLHLLAGAATDLRLTACDRGLQVAVDPASARRFSGPAFSIRGPPAR